MGVRKKFILCFVVLAAYSNAQTSFDGANLALQNLQVSRAIEANYARELIRPAAVSTPFDSQITFVQQRGTLSQKERDTLALYQMVPRELDFSNVDQVSDHELINDAYRDESFLFREHLKKVDMLRAEPLEVLIDHIKSIMQKTMTIPRNFVRNDIVTSAAVKEGITAYILHKFASLGYLTGLQRFIPKHFLNAVPVAANGEIVRGTNVIAVAPGTNFGTKADRILIVGAHWDTAIGSPGYNDNGSGMAALLELARALKQSQCKNSHTYILVAFDMGETGTQGSNAFVNDFLVRMILRPQRYPEIQGAYILDGIGNYNSSAGSQLLPDTFQIQLPEFAQGVVRDGNRGDFIGVIGRRVDQPLYDLLSFHWNNQPDVGLRFKLRQMLLPEDINGNFPDEGALVRNTNFLRSDHVRFWMAHTNDYFASLKSVHLTDTGPARGAMIECYHSFCDTAALNETAPFANIFFLKKITQAMISSVIDATDSQCHRSRSEVKRMGRSVDGNYFFYDKNIQQAVFQFASGVPNRPGLIQPGQVGALFGPGQLGGGAGLGGIPPTTAVGFPNQQILPETIAARSPLAGNQFLGNNFGANPSQFLPGNGFGGQQFGLNPGFGNGLGATGFNGLGNGFNNPGFGNGFNNGLGNGFNNGLGNGFNNGLGNGFGNGLGNGFGGLGSYGYPGNPNLYGGGDNQYQGSHGNPVSLYSQQRGFLPGQQIGAQHSFYPGKNLLNQLSRNGYNSVIDPYFTANTPFNQLAGLNRGFEGNGGFNNNAVPIISVRKRRKRNFSKKPAPVEKSEEDPLPDVEIPKDSFIQSNSTIFEQLDDILRMQ